MSCGRASSKGWRVQWETVPPGKKPDPCSSDGREARNQGPEAHRQSHPRMVSESPGRNESKRRGGPERD